MSGGDRRTPRSAEQVFADHLAQERATSETLRAVCKLYPELACELRRRFEDYLRVRGALGQGVDEPEER